MTRNESFKRRVRARMAKTGEKYGAARRVLVEQARGPAWVSDPGHSDAVITEHTGRDWQSWVQVIDDWPGHADGHTAVARWVQSEHGVEGWWAQAVTVGWERITGRRATHQMSDGTFTANASATITADAAILRETLLEDGGLTALFPGMAAELRSRPTSKNVRVAFDEGTAELLLAPKDGGRLTLSVQHAKLASPDSVQHWKKFWAEWFAALDEARD